MILNIEKSKVDKKKQEPGEIEPAGIYVGFLILQSTLAPSCNLPSYQFINQSINYRTLPSSCIRLNMNYCHRDFVIFSN